MISDIVVDFKPPLDYKEVPSPPPSPPKSFIQPVVKSTQHYSGPRTRLRAKQEKKNKGHVLNPTKDVEQQKTTNIHVKQNEESTITGSGRVLGGSTRSIHERDWSRLGVTFDQKDKSDIFKRLNQEEQNEILK